MCANKQTMRRGIQWAILTICLLLGPGYSLVFWIPANPFSLLTGQVSQTHWVRQHFLLSAGFWNMATYVNSHLPHNTKILLVGNGWGYFLEGFDYVDDSSADWVPYLVTAGQTPSGFTRLLQRQGFEYLVFQEQNLEYLAHVYEAHSLDTYLPAFHTLLDTALIKVQTFDDYTLYQIPSS